MSPGHDDFSTAETLASEPPRRRLPRPLVFAAVTALVVTAGAGVAAATTRDSSPPGSPAPSATATESPAPGDGPSAGSGRDTRRWRGSWGWGYRTFGGGIHGEFVVPGRQEGQWVTVATQVGEVTAVDQNSVTVKSADGYVRRYVVNSDTRINSREGIGAVKVGHRVAVSATVEGGTATARTILDSDLRRGERRPWHERRRDRGGWGDRDGGDSGGSPSPSASPSASATA